jgi:hypothetical protein
MGYNLHDRLRNGIILEDTMRGLEGKRWIKHQVYVAK